MPFDNPKAQVQQSMRATFRVDSARQDSAASAPLTVDQRAAWRQYFDVQSESADLSRPREMTR